MPDRPGLATRLDRALFDDASRQLDRFGLLLGLVVFTLCTLSLVDLHPERADTGSRVGLLVVTVAVAAMFMATVRATGVTRRWRRIADAIALLSVLGSTLTVVGDAVSGGRGEIRPSGVWVVIAVAIPLAVVRRILRHRSVGVSTLLGAISAYLLIAFTFTFAFLTVDGYQDGFFFGQPETTPGFMYFSLTTMTTVGYGDLTATSDLGRLLAMGEAVIGQVFLVTLVAALVGLYTQRPRNPRRDAEA